MSAAVSPSVAEAQASLAPAAAFRPDLVIFDKDGTLVCFHTMWNSWVEELARRMVAEVRQDTVAEELYDMLGYDGATQKVRLGMLAEKTHPYIKQKVGEMLVTRYQLPEEEAARVMDKIWFDTPEDLQIKSTGDLGGLFRQLKKQGIKIAICTSDSREGTAEFLSALSLSGLVDMVLCGDDAASIAKPDPHNALHICAQLGVAPARAVMVGDTPADTIMGQAAHLGLTVGVLTGVGSNGDLSDADVIVESVGEVVELVTDQEAARVAPVNLTSRGLAKIAGHTD